MAKGKKSKGTASAKERDRIIGTEEDRNKRLEERYGNSTPTKKTDSQDEGLSALGRFNDQYQKINPGYCDLLAREAVEAYVYNTEKDGTPKSPESGNYVYTAMYNFLKDGVYKLSSDTEMGRKRIEKMIREDLGIRKSVLEDLIKKGIGTIAFTEGIVKPAIGRLGGILDGLSEEDLTPTHMTDGAKKYLVERAKSLEIRGLEDVTAERIATIDDFKYIAKTIAEYKRGR